MKMDASRIHDWLLTALIFFTVKRSIIAQIVLPNTNELVRPSEQLFTQQQQQSQRWTSELLFAPIPQGFTMTIRCPENFDCQLDVHDATYRELCNPRFEHCYSACARTNSVTPDVVNRCANQRADLCELSVEDRVYGNICAGRLKHLVVTYSCTCTQPAQTPLLVPSVAGGGLAFATQALISPSPMSLCTLRMFRRLCS